MHAQPSAGSARTTTASAAPRCAADALTNVERWLRQPDGGSQRDTNIVSIEVSTKEYFPADRLLRRYYHEEFP